MLPSQFIRGKSITHLGRFFSLLEYTFQSWLEAGYDGVKVLDNQWTCLAGVEQCPDFSAGHSWLVLSQVLRRSDQIVMIALI